MTTEKHKCCGTVFDRGWPHPCSKTAKVERSGKWYCGLHDPVAREEKQKKQHAKWVEQWAKEREEAEALAKSKKQMEHRAACFPELLEALKLIKDRLEACSIGVLASDAYDSFYEDLITKAIAKAEGEQQ